ncbi:MAG: serine/threonine-protein kinase, partial [Verrucomicrobiota bacterium]
MPPTPTDDTLKALLRGDLPADELAQLESLLSDSPELQARLESLSGATEFKSHFHADLDATTKLPRHQPRASSSEHPASSTPSHLGPYEILEHIATGGMGIVYKARDPDLKRTVAIKLLAPALAASDEAKNRFLREAAAAAAIEHPNIVPIYAIDKDSADQPFLVMRFIEGGTLQDYLDHLPKDGTIPDEFIITIATAVARALAAAHGDQSAEGASSARPASDSSVTLVHRDIKPSNILLESPAAPATGQASSSEHPASSIFLTDFGLARAIEETAVLTRSGTFLGTPRFTSPEQAEGLPVVDHRADLFSLGAVLYTLATGETPFSGDTPTTTIYQVVHKAHQPVHEASPKRPQWLGKILDRLLQKNSESRHRGRRERRVLPR